MTLRTPLLAATALAALIAATPARADLPVAIAGPMTGQYASTGDQIRKGAELAIADINAAGGVLGEKLKLEIGDDACDPKQAVAVANQMVNKGIQFMHGHWCSSSTIPASDVYAESGIPVATVSTNPQVTERGLTNLFAFAGRDDQQAIVAAGWIAKNMADKKVAVIDDKSTYGKGIADETARALEAAGVKPVMRESITAGEKDYSGIVAKLKQAGVGLIAFGGYHTEAALILRQAEQAGLDLNLFGGDTLSNSELVSAAGKAANRVLFTFGPDVRQNPAAAPVVERLRKAGVEPEGYTLYAYAAFQLLDQAARQAGSMKPGMIEKALHAGTFETVIGKISFDAKGLSKAPAFVVYRWKDGQYATVQ